MVDTLSHHKATCLLCRGVVASKTRKWRRRAAVFRLLIMRVPVLLVCMIMVSWILEGQAKCHTSG